MLYLKHTTLGPVECEIVRGNSKSAIDVFILKAFDGDGNEIDDDSFLDDLNDVFADQIQEYAVENLGCYYD